MEINNLYEDSEYIREIKYKDFKKYKNKLFIENNKDNNNLFLFYLPGCKHCKQLINAWNELSIRFNNDFKFYTINCDNIKEDNDLLCSEFNIKKYPTIKYTIKEDKYKDYKGIIDKDSLYYFICLYI